MFNKNRKYIISKRGRDIVYTFTTSTDIKYEVVFEYIEAGKCELIYKNITKNSYNIQNYNDNTSIEVFSTIVNIINDFNNLIIPDEMILSYNTIDPLSRYKLTKKLVLFFIRKYKNKAGFDNITFEEIKENNKIIFLLKRNIKGTMLYLKRKRLNKGNEI
tara:strand:- start:2710 stop:3189 length:480 start_codon:yes stop_codon:yes gene_type:complete